MYMVVRSQNANWWNDSSFYAIRSKMSKSMTTNSLYSTDSVPVSNSVRIQIYYSHIAGVSDEFLSRKFLLDPDDIRRIARNTILFRLMEWSFANGLTHWKIADWIRKQLPFEFEIYWQLRSTKITEKYLLSWMADGHVSTIWISKRFVTDLSVTVIDWIFVQIILLCVSNIWVIFTSRVGWTA